MIPTNERPKGELACEAAITRVNLQIWKDQGNLYLI